jgi:hypothetical protein
MQRQFNTLAYLIQREPVGYKFIDRQDAIKHESGGLSLQIH